MGRTKGKVLINTKDIIGKRLGKLEIVSYLGSNYKITLGGERMRHYYVCSCDCGKMCIMQRGNLLNERVHSCGCKRRKENGYQNEKQHKT